MDINEFTSSDLENNIEFQKLSPSEQTLVIENISKKMQPESSGAFLEGANQLMEKSSRERGIGRVFLEDKVMDSLRSVLPKDFDELDSESKVLAIDKARPLLEERVAEIDPVNKNDTAFYADRQLTGIMRDILKDDVSGFGDKRNRFVGGLIQSIAAPLGEEETNAWLARNLPTKPEYDATNASVLTQAAGDFVGQIAMIMGAAAAITASGGTAAAAFAGSTALGLAQNTSRKFQENYNLATGEMGLSEDEAIAAGIAGMPGAVIDSFGDALLLRGIKLGTVNKAFKSMTAAEKAAEIVAKGGSILRDPKALRVFGANFIKGGLTEGVTESLGDAATAWGGYATSGHEGFKPTAESLWQSFWVGGLLGGTFSSIANTGKDVRNTKALKELGQLDQQQFMSMGEQAQQQIAAYMDAENYSAALDVVKKFKQSIKPTEQTATPANQPAQVDGSQPVVEPPVNQQLDESKTPIDMQGQQKPTDVELAAARTKIEDAVAGTAENIKEAPENPAIANAKRTILEANKTARDAVRATLDISSDGGQKVTLGEIESAIDTLLKPVKAPEQAAAPAQVEQQAPAVVAAPAAAPAAQATPANEAQVVAEPTPVPTVEKEANKASLRKKVQKAAKTPRKAAKQPEPTQQAAVPQNAPVSEPEANAEASTEIEAISEQEIDAVPDLIEEIVTEIDNDAKNSASGITRIEKIEKAWDNYNNGKIKAAKKAAINELAKLEAITEEEKDNMLSELDAPKAAKTPAKEAKQKKSKEDQLAPFRDALRSRLAKLEELLELKRMLLPKEQYPASKYQKDKEAVQKLNSRIDAAEKATQLEGINIDLDLSSRGNLFITRADVDAMNKSANIAVMKKQEGAKETATKVAVATTPDESGSLFQSDEELKSITKDAKYKRITELNKTQLRAAKQIIKALRDLGINDQVSDADKILALEINQAINIGNFSDELINKLNAAAPSRAVFQNQINKLKGFGKTTKKVIMMHFDVMALNYLKTGMSLQAFWARVPEVVVVDSLPVDARGQFDTGGKLAGKIVEDIAKTDPDEVVVDVAMSQNQTVVQIPFSPVPNRIVLVRGKYNASTVFHENDHNMIVTGMAQQVVESQEGGVELWNEVLTELGQERGQPWTVQAHERWARAREAWILNKETKSVFRRVFDALKGIFTRFYATGSLDKYQNKTLEKAFVQIYDITSMPVEEVKAKVSRETGHEASKLLEHVPATKLEKAQTLIESAKLNPDLGAAKAELEKNATTLVGDKPEFDNDEVDSMKAALEESYTGEDIPKGEQKYDAVDNYLSAQRDEEPKAVDQTQKQKAKIAQFFTNLKNFIKNISEFSIKEARRYSSPELQKSLMSYFSEDLKLSPSDLANIVYTAETDPELVKWMPDDMKAVLRFVMNVSFVGFDEARAILEKNPNATFVDFMADQPIPDDLKNAIMQSGLNEAFLGKVNEAISTNLQNQEMGANLNPFAVGKIEDAFEGLDLKTRKDKNGKTVYTAESKRKIAERLDALFPQGWVMKKSAEAQGKGIYTKTGKEAKVFSSFLDSAIEKTEYVIEPYNPKIANKENEYRVHVYVRNGVPEVVPFATGNKSSTVPYLLRTDFITNVEEAAKGYAANMTNLKDGDLFGFDVTFTEDGYVVTEVNPVDAATEEAFASRSGYLDFPLYNMAVIAHIQGRTPPHALLARAAARSEFIKQMASPDFTQRVEAIYQNFKDYASFAREMIRNFGEFVVNHINAIFSSLVAGNGKLTNKSQPMIKQVEDMVKQVEESGDQSLYQSDETIAKEVNAVEPQTGVPYSATVYRATSLKQGDKPKMANEGALGSGIYLAGSKGMAEYYLDFDASTGGSLSGRRLAEFSIKLQNPILVDNSKFTGLVDALASTGLNRDKVIDRIEKNLEDRGAIGKWVQAAFQKAGYDGIIAKRSDGSLEIVAYNSSSVSEVDESDSLYQSDETTSPALDELKKQDFIQETVQRSPVARFNELTDSLYRGRDSVTQEEIDAWKAENPEAWDELSQMKEEVLREGGWTEKGVRAGVYKDGGIPLLPSTTGGLGSAYYAVIGGKVEDVSEFAGDVTGDLRKDPSIQMKVGEVAINLGDKPLRLKHPTDIGEWATKRGLRDRFKKWLEYQFEVNEAYRKIGQGRKGRNFNAATVRIDMADSLEARRAGRLFLKTAESKKEVVKAYLAQGFSEKELEKLGYFEDTIETSDAAKLNSFLFDQGIVTSITVDWGALKGTNLEAGDGRAFVEVAVANPEQIKSADPISAGRKITPDQWGDTGNASILYQNREQSEYSNSQIRATIGMGHSMIQMIGRNGMDAKDVNKIQKEIDTLLNSQNSKYGKKATPAQINKATASLIKRFQEMHSNLNSQDKDLLVDVAYQKSFAVEEAGLDEQSYARANNIRRQRGQALTPEQADRVKIQDLARSLYNTFRNARTNNAFKVNVKSQIKPEFARLADKILKLMTRGVDNIMAAFNSTNEDLLVSFANNVNAYNKKEYDGNPEFVDQFSQTIDEVEEAVAEHLVRQFQAYKSAYIDAVGISEEINNLIAQLSSQEQESAMEHYERMVKIVNQIEAAMFQIEIDGDPNGESDSDKRAQKVREKREKIAKTHQRAFAEKFPTADDFIKYKQEKDGGVLTKKFEDILRNNHAFVLEADVTELSDMKLRDFNSVALTMLVGGSNTSFLNIEKEAWRATKIESWKALVASMADRVGNNPLTRPIYRFAARSNFMQRMFNNFDKVFQANVENFHIWIDRFSQYAPVREWFDRQFFAEFQEGVFTEAETARKGAERWMQETIKQYNDDVDTTVNANPYLWVMATIGQYDVNTNPNELFSKVVKKARTSIARTLKMNKNTSTVNEANRNLAALNYMLEGIDINSDTAYDQFMNYAQTRIGKGDAQKAEKRLQLLSDISNYFAADIANQIFIRENIHGEPFTTVVNYLPLKAVQANGSVDKWDWKDIEPKVPYQVAAKNVNAKSNEARQTSLGTDRAYGMDFFNMVERKAVKNALDKYAVLPVTIMSDIFRTEEKTIDGVDVNVPKDESIKTIFGSQPEVTNQLATIKEKITHQMVQIYGITEPPTEFVGGLKKVIGLVQSSMLSGVGQIVQQSAAAIVDYSAREQGNSGYLMDAMIYWSKNYQQYRAWLLKNNPDLYDRADTQGVLEFQRHVNNAGSELASKLDKGWKGVDEMRKLMTLSLRYGDKIGAELIFLAEHMKAVKQSGAMPNNGDYNIDDYSNPAFTTRAMGQLAKYIGTSSAAGRSYWMSDHKQAYFLLRALTGSFQSSAHNMSSQILSAARNAWNLRDDKSPEGKAERMAEYRRIGSIMAQQATFTGFRHIVGAMMTYALVGAIRDAWDDEDGAIEAAEKELDAARKKRYPSKADKEIAITMAERKLADAKAIRRAVINMKQQASGDALFKSMVRDQLQNLHIVGSVGDGLIVKGFMMVPNAIAQQSHAEAQELVIKKLKKERSDALASGDRKRAAAISESISDAQAIEFIPYFYEKKDKSGFGGIVGGVLDPIYTAVKEGSEDISRKDKDFLTARAFVPDMITYMAAAGVGQADVNRIARQLQRIDDELSKNREEANKRAGEKVDKLTNKSKTNYLR